jgi:hypothetical protein
MNTAPRAEAHVALHAGVAGQIDAYATLSGTYAAAGDTRRAVLAACAADICTLQCLLWESGLGQAPDPDAQLSTIGAAVQGSLISFAEDAGPMTARQVVEGARTAMTATFDASVHDLLTERFISLDHLDGLEEAARGKRRLGSRAPDNLLDDLRTTAADCTAIAHAMAAASFDADARTQMRMADMATFEAYLLQSAIDAGDTTRATVDLRWDLAATRLSEIPAEAEDTDTPVDIREILLGLVGPAERTLLDATFEPPVTASA